MYQLFNFPTVSNFGVVLQADWINIRSQLARNLDTVRDYYRSHTMAAQAHGVLVDIINSIGAHEAMDDAQYYLHTLRQTDPIARTLRLTNSGSVGKMHGNQFFGPGVREVLLAYTGQFDWREAQRNWQHLEPVQILSHPLTDLQLPILDARQALGSGVAVIAINIPLLMAQYRAFRQYERLYKESGDFQGAPIHVFIHRWVLPGMMASYLDYALINRLLALYNGQPISASRTRHPFYLTDWSERVDQFYGWIIARLRERTLTFAQILRQIPLATHDSALSMTTLPDFYRTRQVNWALALSRAPLLELLMSVDSVSPGDTNRDHINSILRHAKAYEQDQAYSAVLPSDMAAQARAQIARLQLYQR